MKKKPAQTTALAVIDIPAKADMLPATVPPINKTALIAAMVEVAKRERMAEIEATKGQREAALKRIQDYFASPAAAKALQGSFVAALASEFATERSIRGHTAQSITGSYCGGRLTVDLHNVAAALPTGIREDIEVFNTNAIEPMSEYEIRDLQRSLRSKVAPDTGAKIREALNNPEVYAAIKESLRAVQDS